MNSKLWIPPSVKCVEAYLEGREAYPNFGICQNPYTVKTQEHEDWDHGWDDAQGDSDRMAGI